MSLTQLQIAKLAGVSRGTVDRVLNNRGHVDPGIEKKIREIAELNNYHPNRAGVQLVRDENPIRIGFLIESIETPFMQMMQDEVEKYRQTARAQGAELLIYTNEGFDPEPQVDALQRMIAEGVNGIAVTPVEDEMVLRTLNEISQKIPVVFTNIDMPMTRKLCYVGQDNYQSGRAAASLMRLVLNGRGTVLPVTSMKKNRAVQVRIDAFVEELHRLSSAVKILPVECSEDDMQLAHKIVLQKLSENPGINGIYFSGYGSNGGCSAIRELGKRGKIHVICHDTTEDIVRNIKEGLIDFTIDQDVRRQASQPVSVLMDYLLTGKKPSGQYLLTKIDFRNIYNIE